MSLVQTSKKLIILSLLVQLSALSLQASYLRFLSEKTEEICVKNQFPVELSDRADDNHTAHVVLYSFKVVALATAVIGSIVSHCTGWEFRRSKGKYFFTGLGMSIYTLMGWIDWGING